MAPFLAYLATPAAPIRTEEIAFGVHSGEFLFRYAADWRTRKQAPSGTAHSVQSNRSVWRRGRSRFEKKRLL